VDQGRKGRQQLDKLAWNIETLLIIGVASPHNDGEDEDTNRHGTQCTPQCCTQCSNFWRVCKIRLLSNSSILLNFDNFDRTVTEFYLVLKIWTRANSSVFTEFWQNPPNFVSLAVGHRWPAFLLFSNISSRRLML
jgi:hypothetical protein